MSPRVRLPAPGLYSPATSPLHRWPAGAKLAVLALVLTGLVLVSTPASVAAGGLLAVLGYAVARVGWRVALAQVWPLRWFVLVLVAVQLWLAGPEKTLVTAGGLVVAVALAGLVTVTTRVSAMLAAFTRVLAPLRWFGVDPERIGLVLALAVRAVPVVGELARQVREAHLARGLPADPRTYAVPLVVRTLRQADALGQALAARGLDD
jgi:biotin transport system permease protein